MNDDQTLAEQTTTGTPFGDPTGAPKPPKQWSLSEILTMAKRPEKHASICLRADLEADHERIVRQLAELVTPAGELIDPDADEASLGGESPAGKVERLSRDLARVREEMQDAMWFPRFRGLPSDQLVKFQEEHLPKKEGASMLPYQDQLIAATCLDPALTVDEVRQLRSTLGGRAMTKLVETAMEVNARGGIDVPFSPSFYRPPTQQASAGS